MLGEGQAGSDDVNAPAEPSIESPEDEESDRPVVEIPTHDGTGPVDFAAYRGRLAGSSEVDGGCVWLQVEDVEFPILWPPGYVARFDPVELIDAHGVVVAREGDVLEMEGGTVESDVPRCRLGQDQITVVHTLKALPEQ